MQMRARSAVRQAATLFVCMLVMCSQGADARRVILMIGDGMGYKHVEITRNYLGRSTAMETLPVKYGVSTYE